MAYIPETLLRIMQHGPVSAKDFLDQHTRLHLGRPVDGTSEEKQCTICLEPLLSSAPTSFSQRNITPTQPLRDRPIYNDRCKHIFHTHCLLSFVRHGNTCPVCRCHWFDSAAEEEKAWEISLALQALDLFDYTTATKAQKRIKVTIHAVAFDEMPSIVAYWLSRMPRVTEPEKRHVLGRVARSAEGPGLLEAIVAAFREMDEKKMRLGKLVKKLTATAVKVAGEGESKGVMREDHAAFLGAVVETVVGYYAYSQGLANVSQSRSRRLLRWLHLA